MNKKLQRQIDAQAAAMKQKDEAIQELESRLDRLEKRIENRQ